MTPSSHAKRRRASRKAAAAIACACAAFLWILGDDRALLPDAPPVAGAPRRALASSSVASSSSPRLCVAVVKDERIVSAAIVDDAGRFDLSLPRDYPADGAAATVECTRYAPAKGGGERATVAATDATTAAVPRRGEEGGRLLRREYATLGGGNGTASADCRDPLSFQPGHLDRAPGDGGGARWVDRCTGPKLTRDVRSGAGCPVAASPGRSTWALIVGDSVTRGFVITGFKHHLGVGTRGRRDLRSWVSDRVTSKKKLPDSVLAPLTAKGAPGDVWLSYTYNFLRPTRNATEEPLRFDVPLTWGDFVRQRGEGPRAKDPPYADDRTPDLVFFSPGYHASKLSADEYGAALDRTLTSWGEKARAIAGPGAALPQMHLLLNYLPAPWKIPAKHKDDVPYRTLLNEYRKNLAILDVAKKHAEGGREGKGGGFEVRSVVDVFSVELAFNGHKGGPTAHGDAVHITPGNPGASHVIRAVMDKIVDTVCYMDNHKDWDEVLSELGRDA